MKETDRKRVPRNSWLECLAGNHANYPEVARRNDLANVRQRVQGTRHDPTTADTRLADDLMKFNPASVISLVAEDLRTKRLAFE
jgi:hypothetical protein